MDVSFPVTVVTSAAVQDIGTETLPPSEELIYAFYYRFPTYPASSVLGMIKNITLTLAGQSASFDEILVIADGEAVLFFGTPALRLLRLLFCPCVLCATTHFGLRPFSSHLGGPCHPAITTSNVLVLPDPSPSSSNHFTQTSPFFASHIPSAPPSASSPHLLLDDTLDEGASPLAFPTSPETVSTGAAYDADIDATFVIIDTSHMRLPSEVRLDEDGYSYHFYPDGSRPQLNEYYTFARRDRSPSASAHLETPSTPVQPEAPSAAPPPEAAASYVPDYSTAACAKCFHRGHIQRDCPYPPATARAMRRLPTAVRRQQRPRRPSTR